MDTHWAESLFSWTTFDVNPFLPNNWDAELEDIAAKYGKNKILKPTSVTSREDFDVQGVAVRTVGGICLIKNASWLHGLYVGPFKTLAQRAARGPVYCARDQRIGINLNIQIGSVSRYEAHVDSNPIEGLLYVTTHFPGEGGQLVVGLRSSARGVKEIGSRSAMIYPVRGHLIFFDARSSPHFVQALKSDDSQRLVVAMNYYTDECTEADRPSDLNRHLGLDD
ncbi:2OG-Fe(II) oxygenase [Nocardia brasiliensis]|uniref:2OG-Fe(II) oxygenase n=1 Tax=Nocardia brasiliensis TaxID=37326 RepID=UPI0024578021|nr:2OG-Fe(II) oxygenase [Nocardia brasiliensis]